MSVAPQFSCASALYLILCLWSLHALLLLADRVGANVLTNASRYELGRRLIRLLFRAPSFFACRLVIRSGIWQTMGALYHTPSLVGCAERE